MWPLDTNLQGKHNTYLCRVNIRVISNQEKLQITMMNGKFKVTVMRPLRVKNTWFKSTELKRAAFRHSQLRFLFRELSAMFKFVTFICTEFVSLYATKGLNESCKHFQLLFFYHIECFNQFKMQHIQAMLIFALEFCILLHHNQRGGDVI